MRFLVEPGGRSLTLLAWLFLGLVCVAIPLGAVQQHRQMAGATTPPPERMQIYTGAVITHTILVLFAWAVSANLDIDLLAPYAPQPLHVAVGLVALALGLLGLVPRFEIRNPVGEERAKLIVPRTRNEHVAFYGICVTAGIAEEIAYRGLLFTLVAILTGGWWVPALVAAAAFGIAHLFQGWRSAGLAVVMSLLAHIVVGLTGTLFVVIVVHMLHDAIAGTVTAARARRTETGALRAV